MIKVSKYKEINALIKYSEEVKKYIYQIIKILDENYGADRDIESDLGGYVLVIESLEDIKELKNGMLKDILPEYTDKIMCSEGVKYTSSLFLLSSDFSVVVIADEELSKLLLD